MRKVFIKGEQKRNRKRSKEGLGPFSTLRFGSGPPDGAKTDRQQDQEWWRWAAHGSSVSSRQPEEPMFTTRPCTGTSLWTSAAHPTHVAPLLCPTLCPTHWCIMRNTAYGSLLNSLFVGLDQRDTNGKQNLLWWLWISLGSPDLTSSLCPSRSMVAMPPYGWCISLTQDFEKSVRFGSLLSLHLSWVMCVLPLPHWQSFCPLGPATSSKASFLWY